MSEYFDKWITKFKESIDKKEENDVFKLKEELDVFIRKQRYARVSTTFSDWDIATQGFKEGSINLIATHKGACKQAFVNSIVSRFAQRKLGKLAIISFREKAEYYWKRLLSSISGLSTYKLDLMTLEPHEIDVYKDGFKSLTNLDITINNFDYYQFEAFSEYLGHITTIESYELIILDDINTLRRNADFVKTLRHLATLVKNVKTVFVLLSQIECDLQNRIGFSKRPRIEDAELSKGQLKYFNQVALLWRPSYYLLNAWDIYDNENTEDQGELIISKSDTGRHNFRLIFKTSWGLYEDFKNRND